MNLAVLLNPIAHLTQAFMHSLYASKCSSEKCEVGYKEVHWHNSNDCLRHSEESFDRSLQRIDYVHRIGGGKKHAEVGDRRYRSSKLLTRTYCAGMHLPRESTRSLRHSTVERRSSHTVPSGAKMLGLGSCVDAAVDMYVTRCKKKARWKRLRNKTNVPKPIKLNFMLSLLFSGKPVNAHGEALELSCLP